MRFVLNKLQMVFQKLLVGLIDGRIVCCRTERRIVRILIRGIVFGWIL